MHGKYLRSELNSVIILLNKFNGGGGEESALFTYARCECAYYAYDIIVLFNLMMTHP